MSFLLYDLKPGWKSTSWATCSALTASYFPAQYFNVLSQLEKILGVRCFQSLAAFMGLALAWDRARPPPEARWLGGTSSGVRHSCRLPAQGPAIVGHPVPGQHGGGPGAPAGRLLRSPGVAGDVSRCAGAPPGAGRGQAGREPRRSPRSGSLSSRSKPYSVITRPVSVVSVDLGDLAGQEILLRRDGPGPGAGRRSCCSLPTWRYVADPPFGRAPLSSLMSSSARCTRRPVTSGCLLLEHYGFSPALALAGPGQRRCPHRRLRPEGVGVPPGAGRCRMSASSTRSSWAIIRCWRTTITDAS